jgi:aspartate/methionine/tyrosine aminotransferase
VRRPTGARGRRGEPNNPTGAYLKRADLDLMASLCRERGLALIGDEVFAGKCSI